MAAPLTSDELETYRRDGCLLQPGLLAQDEVALVLAAAERDSALREHAFGRDDGEGGNVRLALWNHPGDDVYGAVARSARIVERAEQLVGDEVYHYHSKMILKDPSEGGAWAWHQDYGYWYENGLLAPDLCSVFMALDPATRQNGCLQVVPRSHHLGRIAHVLTGEQAGADRARVEEVLARFPAAHAVMAPGDALFFHPNLLHRSDQNRSAARRWAMICCYNARSNDPVREHHHPRYTPLVKLEGDAIRAVGARGADSQAAWLDPSEDHSATGDV
ncbi:MAG: phytanoyl-CoA dioxygenase family protein [Planctomycetota bacterium]|nr:phytanoyl-CoA dioxygenase family protein [Planctomycetota bacterium]